MTLSTKRIANKLVAIALGEGWDDQALIAAQQHFVDDGAAQAVLNRYRNGQMNRTDFVRLQELALRLYTAPINTVQIN